MFTRIFGYFSQGFLFAKNNPQIIYTIFLIIVIPLAFILSGREFLQVAKQNQERLEKERIGGMQDVFTELASQNIGDPLFLQKSIERIKSDSESIDEFKVVVFVEGSRNVIASLDQKDIGTPDEKNEMLYGAAIGNIILEFRGPEGRRWVGARVIHDKVTGNPVGISLVGTSMASIDKSAMQNIRSAYYFLFFIVLAISFLLLRQAKIIDYTVLYKKLQEVDQMKDDFVSMAAHELRTPLTVVKGYADMLSDSQNLKDEDRENTTRIMASVDQLNALIGDILDVVRLGQGKMAFKPEVMNVSPIIEKVIETFQYVAHEKGLEISYEKNDIPNINVDAEKLRQILVNIIGNSIKYTPSGSVKVFAETEHGVLSIRVRDTGIGISAEDQKNLFSKFYRVRSKDTEDIRGTGLGLWIAAQVVNNMGGKITVESIKGKGTDFVISFPVVRV